MQMTPASGSDFAMTNSGNKIPRAVPRLQGWTTTVERRQDKNSGSHQRRWVSVTTGTMRWRGTSPKARCNDNCSSDWPPSSEQYCFGVQTPSALVVNEPSRRPSPPARITTHNFRGCLLIECGALPLPVSQIPSEEDRAYTADLHPNIRVVRYWDYPIPGNSRTLFATVFTCSGNVHITVTRGDTAVSMRGTLYANRDNDRRHCISMRGDRVAN